jgi:endoglucanase
MPVELGKGPAIVYKDSWTHYDRRVINQLLDVAAEHDIAVQPTIFPGFGSDGAALIRAGIPTALLGIATRYTHAPFEMADERDIAGALELLLAYVTTPAIPLELGPA